MRLKALVASVVTCVCAVSTGASLLAGATDIVLYAGDATNLRGNWARRADASAAGGQTLASADKGWANTGSPQAWPADSFDFVFTAPAATSYRVWLRMRATGNSKFNDSLFAQFSDAVDGNGSSLFAIGTRSGLTVNLANDSIGAGLNGWGWQNGAYWLSQPSIIRFASSGTHTIRIQTREDGVQIDQLVLSPVTYLSAAPGPVSNDSTIVAKPAVVAAPAVPAPWTAQDVGATGVLGTSTYANNVFSVAGAGADIWGTADAFRLVAQPSIGDTQIVTRVFSLQNTSAYAKAGVMLRETAGSDSAHVLLDVRPNGSIEFMTRSATGAATTFLGGGTQSLPAWLKLTRSAATVVAAVSADGANWTTIGSVVTAIAPTALMGIAVTSHDTTQLSGAAFDNVSVVALTPRPAMPTAPLPTAAARNVATSATLAWSATGATTFDLNFGTTNPPARVASGTASASYAPGSLAAGTTYYWQVTARNSGGATTGPVWSFTTKAPPSATPKDIVLYAAGVSALQGNWSLVADATAARGHALSSLDKGWANPGAPLAAPADSFEFTFTASSATPYHVWMRMRATGNSKYNDSVYAQFSDSVDANRAAIYRIGTTGGLVINLATDAAAGSLSGWGWQDGAYWLTQTSTVSFAADGLHTLRVQTREDGVSIDQIVLSPVTYLNAAPGSVTNDSTIIGHTSVPPTPPPAPGAPTAYRAIVDRNAYAKPAVPALGGAGYSFIDPTFGSKILRVTDANTRPGLTSRSFRVPSNAHLAAWNASSTAFFVVSNDGTSIPYAFDPATMTASRIQPAASGDGGLTLAFYVEPQFSIVDPHVIYGAVNSSNNRTIARYDFRTGAYTTIVNLDTIVGGLANTYVGGLMTGGTPSENLMTFFGGASQDNHYLALWSPVGTLAGRKLVNTVDSTVNGVSTGTVLNFHLHSAQIDKSGRYVFLYPTAVDLAAPRSAAQVFLWDTTTDTFTAITPAMMASGHDAAGYGYWVNQDCCTSSTWDAAQWQVRNLTSLAQTADLISPVPATKEVFLADHTIWNNAQPSSLVPVISSTYRYGVNPAPWRAWDDEIIGIDTTGGSMVYRFAHHRSDVGSDADPSRPYFWYEPIANVSPNGKWVLFTSNWEKTLGRDSSEGTFRQDVFLVQLTPF